MQSARWFRLSSRQEADGIFCDRDGLFVGEVSLLERVGKSCAAEKWQRRDTASLDSELTDRFGLPVETARKTAGIAAVARALNNGDLARAQIIALYLEIPDPPPLTKAQRSTVEIIKLASRLHASGMLKADWDPAEHPRWPAGSPGGIGGEFAPVGANANQDSSSDAKLIPVQETVPAPLEIPFPRLLPRTIPRLPSEILPPPIAVPQNNPKELPTNPYPRNPKCMKEWAEAEEFCENLRKQKKLGSGDSRRNRGFGKWMYECLMGRVSGNCSGRPVEGVAASN
jgi:hypothetical protein